MRNNLRGIIFNAYPSISSFARAMHWDRKKASRIINNKQEPSQKDIEEMVAVLKINNASDFVNIFFADLSTMWTSLDPFNYNP